MNLSKALKPLTAFSIVAITAVSVLTFIGKREQPSATLPESKQPAIVKNEPALAESRKEKYSQSSHKVWPELPLEASDTDIKNSRLFAVPLIATAEFNQEDNTALAKLLLSLRDLSSQQRYEAIERWLSRNTDSRWADSLRFQQASYRFSRGYFGESREKWTTLWNQHKDAAAQTGAHTLANEILSRLLETNLSVANAESLRTLVEEMEGRQITGVLNAKRFRAAEALWLLEHTGAQNIMCGPLALNAIADNLNQPYRMPVLGKVTPDYIDSGLPLFELASMAEKDYGFSPLMVRRTDSSAGIPTPSVIHSTEEHYYAVLEKNEAGTEYFIEDQTLSFTGWVDSEALEQSTSGHFLLASNTLPEGFEALSKTDSLGIFGRDGAHGTTDPSETTTDDDCFEGDG